jgi:hypothetical protein
MNKNISSKDMINLSAYLDGQLSAKDRMKFESRLKNEEALQQSLREFRQTKILLRQAGNVAIPRNFTLTQEMAARIKPVRKSRMLPALSISSALAAFLLVFALLFEFLPGFQGLTNAWNAESETALLMEAAAPMDSRDSQAPMILEWGDPSLKGLGGSGGGGEATGLGGGPAAIKEAPQPETGLVPPEIIGGGVDNPPGTPQITAEDQSTPEPISGTGPILGIRSADETDYYNNAVIGILDEQINDYQNPINNNLPLIRWIQILSGAVAFVTGISALLVWKRLRF